MKKILYILVLLLLPLYAFSEENWTKKAEATLNDKTIEDPFERWKKIFFDMSDNLTDISFEEALTIYQDLLLPFVDKKVKDADNENYAKALIYNEIACIYQDKGAFEEMSQCEVFYTKGINYAEKSAHDGVQAFLYRNYGRCLVTMGNIPLGHEYIYKSINLYESLKDYQKIADCLFLIGENLSQIRDTTGLRRVMKLLEELVEKQTSDENHYSLYVLYTVQGIYNSILSEDHPENTQYHYSSYKASQNLIHLLENDDELRESAGIAFPYYNFAINIRSIYPDQHDSIAHYLDKALDAAANFSFDQIYVHELKICVYTLYAELHFEQKKYEQAEKEMLYVLSLLDEIPDFNSVIVDYTEAYKFFVMYYDTMNRPEEALKYQKLLTENEKRRYENDKIVAMNDMLAKHEVEKKNEQIDRLHERERNSRKILILTIFLIVVLLIALLILFRFHKLRKKNLEQSIYESVLLSELKQNELEQNLREKELLQQQYDDLRLQAEHHEQKIQSYNEELKRIKQQLEQKPTKTIIEKITQLILKSGMQKTEREQYVKQLSELDIEMMEQGYLTATEKISNMDMKYLVCFAIDMDTADISLLFNIAPTSVYTVRYRIRKKFGEKNTFKFLM